MIDRLEDFLAELRALADHGLDHVRRRVGEARQVVVALNVEDVVEQEKRVVDGCLVDRHRILPLVARRR